jgi:hypothetical protein
MLPLSDAARGARQANIRHEASGASHTLAALLVMLAVFTALSSRVFRWE